MIRWTLALVVTLVACERPPLETQDGKLLFETICARCHGPDGKGEPTAKLRLGVPDMTDPAWQRAHPDDLIRQTVEKGSKSQKMPGFGDYFSDAQLSSIIAHIRTLAR